MAQTAGNSVREATVVEIDRRNVPFIKKGDQTLHSMLEHENYHAEVPVCSAAIPNRIYHNYGVTVDNGDGGFLVLGNTRFAEYAHDPRHTAQEIEEFNEAWGAFSSKLHDEGDLIYKNPTAPRSMQLIKAFDKHMRSISPKHSLRSIFYTFDNSTWNDPYISLTMNV